MTEPEWDQHHYTDDIVCPWCGAHTDATDFCRDGPQEEYECEECEKSFIVEAEYSVTYSTSKKREATDGP